MTEKRFTLTKGFDEHERQIRDNGKIIMGCFHEVQAKPIVDLLNALHEENKELKKENEQLAKEKERYKRLSEIRREEIDNRILTIKEFIENCSDNKVKKILEDLFYSEVKEYDLSAQNRKLFHENKQLKEEKKLLKNKLDRIGDILPHYLSCAEISEFRSKTFKEDIALMKCWNKRYQK